MIGGATIGRYHDADLRYINDPISQYYIPYADTITDCETLKQWDNKLTAQIQYWNIVLGNETNGTAINNVNQIISIQTDKQTQYKTKIAAVCNTTPPTGGGATDTKNNSLLWIMAAGAGILILFGGKIFGKRKTA